MMSTEGNKQNRDTKKKKIKYLVYLYEYRYIHICFVSI